MNHLRLVTPRNPELTPLSPLPLTYRAETGWRPIEALVLVGGVLLVGALGWFLYGVNASRESGLGVPPDAEGPHAAATYADAPVVSALAPRLMNVEDGLIKICNEQNGEAWIMRAPCRVVCKGDGGQWSQKVPTEVCEGTK